MVNAKVVFLKQEEEEQISFTRDDESKKVLVLKNKGTRTWKQQT